MNRRRFCATIGGVASLVSTNAFGARTARRHEMESKCFGASARIVVHGVARQRAEAAMRSAFAELAAIEKIMSIYRPDSQLSLLNREGRLHHPDQRLLRILRQSQHFSKRTKSAFDVTVQPLWDLFHAHKGRDALPTPQAISSAQRKVDHRNVIIDDDEIELRNGASVTLNGIAQGFATDRATQLLTNHGIEHAMLDIGELAGLGAKDTGRQWNAGIQHPRTEDAYAAVVALDGRCLATSGDYQTSFSADHRFHHIFDPRTGQSPLELSSVSVLAPTATEADALSTALMVIGLEQGFELISRSTDVDAMFIRKDGRTLATAGFPVGASR